MDKQASGWSKFVDFLVEIFKGTRGGKFGALIGMIVMLSRLLPRDIIGADVFSGIPSLFFVEMGLFIFFSSLLYGAYQVMASRDRRIEQLTDLPRLEIQFNPDEVQYLDSYGSLQNVRVTLTSSKPIEAKIRLDSIEPCTDKFRSQNTARDFEFRHTPNEWVEVSSVPQYVKIVTLKEDGMNSSFNFLFRGGAPPALPATEAYSLKLVAIGRGLSEGAAGILCISTSNGKLKAQFTPTTL